MSNTTQATGWKARDFALKGIDGKIYSLAEVRGPKGTLVVFICNHCPYVKASINRIVAEANALRGIGIICTRSMNSSAFDPESNS
jgi:peroxiredoxin